MNHSLDNKQHSSSSSSSSSNSTAAIIQQHSSSSKVRLPVNTVLRALAYLTGRVRGSSLDGDDEATMERNVPMVLLGEDPSALLSSEC